jgi:hypothetical protein
VEVADGQNDIIILAIAIAVDMMAHGDEQNKGKRREKKGKTD